MPIYINHNSEATPEERGLGSWLNEQAHQGNLLGVTQVIGLPKSKDKGKSNPDYRFVGEDTGRDADADAVIATGDNFESTLNNALGKVLRQANNIVIELGTGASARVADSEVHQYSKQVFKTSGRIKRLIVVRRHGASRDFVFKAIRPT